MSILIIAEPYDVAALRVASVLRGYNAPLVHVSVDQLLLAPSWLHDPLGETVIKLGNGLVLTNDEIGSVFSRIHGVDPPQFAGANQNNRTYAQGEFYSLLLSWLEQLGPKVHNPPHAGNLGGVLGSALEDRLRFASQGLPAAPFTAVSSAKCFSDKTGVVTAWRPGWDESALSGLPFEPAVETSLAGGPALRVMDPEVVKTHHVTVVGNRAIGDGLTPEAEELAVRCVKAGNLTIAGVVVQEIDGGGFGLCSINPTPDLSNQRSVEAVAGLLIETLDQQEAIL